ncbi:hypothetical protein [Thalassovita sp.]|nr:hypothetical protein [Thalassovita sp.]
MRNAQTNQTGIAPDNDTLTLHALLTEAGLTASLGLEWLLDRVESREAIR